ncbi:MAG: signal peptidase I [Planctomycetota bacterium]
MRGTGAFIRDNLEAFAVAIAMALVIRHFSLEAFRIPTGSMKPTLYGDGADDRGRKLHGDRILVDKTVWLRRDPKRFEVAVFQFPLNRNQNYIKRITGLPGEWLQVADGDIWSSRDEGKTWAIARKPDGVRDQLFYSYYPSAPLYPNAFRGLRCWDHDSGWKVEERNQRFEVDAGEETATLRFKRKVLPYDDIDNKVSDPRGPYVGDVRIRFDLEVERAGVLSVVLMEHGWIYKLALSKSECAVVFENQSHRVPLDARLEEGSIYCVSFANVDDTLVVDIDGDVQVIPYPNATSRPMREKECTTRGGAWGKHSIAIDARECAAVLSDLRIDRDVHYFDSQRDNPPDYIWRVPDGHYFMMGDNTQSSSDSRKWRVAEATLQNGEVIRWEVNPKDPTVTNPSSMRPPRDRRMDVGADIDGLERAFASSEIAEWDGSVKWSFVSRDHLIGRAFAVFWPFYLPPLSTGPTRIKLIR